MICYLVLYLYFRKQCYEYAKKITVPLFENDENKGYIK